MSVRRAQGGSAPWCAIIPALAGLIGCAGCGAVSVDGLVSRALSSAMSCDGQPLSVTHAANMAILDWTGGVSPIYPDETLSGLDLSRFTTDDGGTLADDAELFQESVRVEVTRILCELPDTTVVVVNDEAFGWRKQNVVHLTQAYRPDGRGDIGQGEYDPCNTQQDNAAIIFGERIRELGGAYSFDDWVQIFANVCAHELGHTLGFAHIERTLHTPAAHAFTIELMLDGHTMDEMRRPQRFLVAQSNCGDFDADAMAHIITVAATVSE